MAGPRLLALASTPAELMLTRLAVWVTRVGTIELPIPKLRDGSYFPSLLEPAGVASGRCWR